MYESNGGNSSHSFVVLLHSVENQPHEDSSLIECRGKVKLLKWSKKALRSSYAIVFIADHKTTLIFELGLIISENVLCNDQPSK